MFTMSVPYEGYSTNASRALNKISTLFTRDSKFHR